MSHNRLCLRVIYFYLLVSICGFLCACKDSPGSPHETDHLISIKGTVTNANTNAAIENASITLQLGGTTKGGGYTPGETLASTKADKDGYYKLKARYNCQRTPNLRASAEGYQGWNYGVHCQSKEQTVNFKLKPLSSKTK